MEASTWQTELTTVRERNRYAFDNSLFCDIEFSVLDSNEEKVTFKAHKYVLAISSPVFETMFYGELAETGPTIDLPDCTKEGLQEMLHYVYSDEVNLTGRNVMDVLYLAKKYMMPFLENECSEYIQIKLRPEEVFIVLPQAKQIRNEKAELCCWNVIDFETQRAVTSEPFLEISRELLCEVLSRETLHVEEIELFKAVDKWASNHIKEEELKNDGATKRKVLGEEVIQLIRFPVMSQHQFAEFVIDSNILVLAETNEFIKVRCSATTSEAVFNAKKREGQWNEKWSPNRFRSMKGSDNQRKMHTGGQQHCIQFKVNKPVYLAGIILFGAQFQETKIKLTIGKGLNALTIGELASGHSQFGSTLSFASSATAPSGFTFGTILPAANPFDRFNAPVSSSFSSRFKRTYVEVTREKNGTELLDGSYYGFKVLLNDSVPLEPNEWYLIEATFNGEYTSFAGSEGQDAVKCDDVIITFKDVTPNSSEKTCTTVETGQFPSFLLKRKIDLKKNIIRENLSERTK